MLLNKQIPQKFWGEAVNTSCHIGNRIFFRVGTKKPRVKYFRVFGSKCYILNDRENLGKFDARSDEGMFLGYSTTSRAYRVFNKRTKTMIESINVKIDDALSKVEMIDDGEGLSTKEPDIEVEALDIEGEEDRLWCMPNGKANKGKSSQGECDCYFSVFGVISC